MIVLSGTLGVGAPQAQAPAVQRTVLRQDDLGIPGYALAMIRVDIPVGGREGKHKHAGALVGLVEAGTLTLDYEGKPTAQFKVGDTFFVEAGKIHEGINKGTMPIKVTAAFVMPKDQPMTVPVP
jgi:quercetin dioxygenase-like cupin family protein